MAISDRILEQIRAHNERIIAEMYEQFSSKLVGEVVLPADEVAPLEIVLSEDEIARLDNADRREVIALSEAQPGINPNHNIRETDPLHEKWLRQVFRDMLEKVTTPHIEAFLSEEERGLPQNERAQLLLEIEREARALLVKSVERKLHPDILNQHVRNNADNVRAFATFFVGKELNSLPFNTLTQQAQTRNHAPGAGAQERDPDPLTPRETAEKSRLFQLYLRLNSIYNDSARYQSSISIPIQALLWLVNRASIIAFYSIVIVQTIAITLVSITKLIAEAIILRLFTPDATRKIADFAQEPEHKSRALDALLLDQQLGQFFAHTIQGADFEEAALYPFGDGSQYMTNNPNGVMELALYTLRGFAYWKLMYANIFDTAVAELPSGNKAWAILMRIIQVTLATALLTFIAIPSEIAVRVISAFNCYVTFPLIVAAKTLSTGILNIPLYIEDGVSNVLNWFKKEQPEPAATQQPAPVGTFAIEWTEAPQNQDQPARPRSNSGLRLFDQPRRNPELDVDEPAAENTHTV